MRKLLRIGLVACRKAKIEEADGGSSGEKGVGVASIVLGGE